MPWRQRPADLLEHLTTMLSITIIQFVYLFPFCWFYFKTCFFLSHFPKRIKALEKQLAKFHLQCTSDHIARHAAPLAEKCVMVDLHLAAWIRAMASGNIIGFMAWKDIRHSISSSLGYFCLLL